MCKHRETWTQLPQRAQTEAVTTLVLQNSTQRSEQMQHFASCIFEMKRHVTQGMQGSGGCQWRQRTQNEHPFWHTKPPLSLCRFPHLLCRAWASLFQVHALWRLHMQREHVPFPRHSECGARYDQTWSLYGPHRLMPNFRSRCSRRCYSN